MASYNGNINLLALSGAKICVGPDKDNPQRPYVCIPLDVNEIRVEPNQNDPTKQVAKLRVNIWPLNENYKNTIRRNNAERGDTNKDVPTHEMQISYSVDYIKAVAKKFPKLVEQVKEASKEKDPDIVNQDPQDENTHLFKAIRNRMNKRLAQLYQPKPAANQQQNYQQPSYGTASATSWTPPASGYDPSQMEGYGDPNSDLPF